MKTRLARLEAQDMGELMQLWVREMNLGRHLEEQRVLEAWDKVSGLRMYTLGKYFRNGVLYVSVSSSVLRSSLRPRLGELVKALNVELHGDPLFSSRTKGPVKSIMLK